MIMPTNFTFICGTKQDFAFGSTEGNKNSQHNHNLFDLKGNQNLFLKELNIFIYTKIWEWDFCTQKMCPLSGNFGCGILTNGLTFLVAMIPCVNMVLKYLGRYN